MSNERQSPKRHPPPAERYRLYIDESGDHVFRDTESASHRYLCLLGCWFCGGDYLLFDNALREFKQAHIPHSPDDPLILHREDIINRRKEFYRLRDPAASEAFDAGLLDLLAKARFCMTAVVIDKQLLREKYATPAHPYHLAIGFLLQRYCGLLNRLSRQGDVMAESRGGTEDRLLKDSYARVYQRGAWMVKAASFQQALTSGQLKVKPKSANIAGLQLADLLAHPVRQSVLLQNGRISGPLGGFAEKILRVCDGKFNRHLYNGQVQGYGWVLFPS